MTGQWVTVAHLSAARELLDGGLIVAQVLAVRRINLFYTAFTQHGSPELCRGWHVILGEQARVALAPASRRQRLIPVERGLCTITRGSPSLFQSAAAVLTLLA